MNLMGKDQTQTEVDDIRHVAHNYERSSSLLRTIWQRITNCREVQRNSISSAERVNFALKVAALMLLAAGNKSCTQVSSM